jgi:hypothetical protein
MIIGFIVDTSASMSRTCGGMTLLDVAKSAVEHFLKVRSSPALKGSFDNLSYPLLIRQGCQLNTLAFLPDL